MLQVAYEADCRALPASRHKFSPRKFIQPQLMACLVPKGFLRLDYRGLAARLADHPDLCESIGLKAVPHLATFQKAAARLLAAVPGRRMFDAVLEYGRQAGIIRRRVPPGGRRRDRAGVAAHQRLITSGGGPSAEIPTRRGLTPTSPRSSWWSTAPATWCWRRSRARAGVRPGAIRASTRPGRPPRPDYSYHAQAEVDGEDQIIVAAEVTVATNDEPQAVPMATAALENLEAAGIERPLAGDGAKVPIPNMADTCSFSEKAVAGLERIGTDPYLAVERQRHHDESVASESAAPRRRRARRSGCEPHHGQRPARTFTRR